MYITQASFCWVDINGFEFGNLILIVISTPFTWFFNIPKD